MINPVGQQTIPPLLILNLGCNISLTSTILAAMIDFLVHSFPFASDTFPQFSLSHSFTRPTHNPWLEEYNNFVKTLARSPTEQKFKTYLRVVLLRFLLHSLVAPVPVGTRLKSQIDLFGWTFEFWSSSASRGAPKESNFLLKVDRLLIICCVALLPYVLWKNKKIFFVHFLHSCLFGVMHKAKLFSCCIVLTTIFLSFAYFGQIVHLKFFSPEYKVLKLIISLSRGAIM